MRLLLLTLCFSTATAMRHRAIGRSMVRHRNNVASAKAARTDPALAKQGWLLCPPSNSGCFSALWGGSGSGFSCPKETEELKVPKRKFVNEDIKKKMNALVKAGFNAMTKEEREALVSGARSRVTGRQMMGPGKLGQANALRRNAAFEQQVAFGGIGASSLLKDMEREDAYENTCRCGAGSGGGGGQRSCTRGEGDEGEDVSQREEEDTMYGEDYEEAAELVERLVENRYLPEAAK